MARYIDADLLEIETQSLEDVGQGKMQFYSVEEINNAPTADVQPIIHAKWIDTNDDGFLYHRIYKCTHCGDTVCNYPENIQKYKYCSNCGAKMDKEQNND